MAESIFKFSIKHPRGVRVIRFRINYREYNEEKIYTYQTISLSDITIEGEMELNIVRSYVNIEIEAVGTANTLITFNVEYKTKKLLKDSDSKIVVDQATGRVVAIKNNVSLNPDN